MDHLILLHGALGHSNQTDFLKAELSKNFHVHSLLFKGHGSNEKEELHIGKLVEQLNEYYEHNNIESAHLFGYSMGGYVALCYALQQPKKVLSILTLATKLNWTPEGVAKEVKMLNADVILEKVPKYAQQLEGMHGSDWKQLLHSIAQLMSALGDQPLLSKESYGEIDTRVQLMVGDSDVMVSIEETNQAVQSIPNAKFCVLPDTKHPIEKIRPQLLLGLMKDFWGIN